MLRIFKEYFIPILLFICIVFTTVSNKYLSSLSNFTKSANFIFTNRTIHIDLKCAPPKLEYFRELIPFIKKLGFDSILMEYEDMFPYSGRLEILRAKNAYSEEAISEILNLAYENELEIIPLIPTFGHMEFVLKHSAFDYLKENVQRSHTICPSDLNSMLLIREMLQQIKDLHSKSKTIHIGAYQAWNIGEDNRCLYELLETHKNSRDRLKLAHISSVAKYAKKVLGFERVLALNDLFEDVPVALLKEYRLGEFLIPAIWSYGKDVNKQEYFPNGMFDRFSKVFNKMIFTSSFKGAGNYTQIYSSIDRYLKNLKSYVSLYHQNQTTLNGKVSEIILSGRSQFWHGHELCELFPEAIPALVSQTIFMNNPRLNNDKIEAKTLKFLKCKKQKLKPIEYHGKEYTPRKEAKFSLCKFPGSDVFQLIEKLHFFTWKIKETSNESSRMKKLKKEQILFKKEFQETLSKYYYEDTVEEFIIEKIDSLFEIEIS